MKTILLSIIILIQSMISFSQNKLVGTWNCQISQDYTMTIVLKSDGTGLFDNNPIKYKFTNTSLTLSESSDFSTTYNYSLSNNQLVLSGGDLQQSLTFVQSNTNSNKQQAKATTNSNPHVKTAVNNTSHEKINPVPQKTTQSIIGTWKKNDEIIEFKENNNVIYMGQTYQYTIQNNYVTFITNQGNISFQYSISGNNLTLQGNNSSVTYTRTTQKQDQTQQVSNTFPANAKIAGEIVGKWCVVKGSSSYGSQTTISSSSECITINADGTYLYYYEGGFVNKSSNINVSTESNDSDKGTWRLVGNTLYVQSQKSGFKKYTLLKQNNKNNDPMLVIDGKSFVTYFNKPAW